MMMTTTPFTPQQALASWKQDKETLALVCQHAQGFYTQGWLQGTSGNLSHRVALPVQPSVAEVPLSFYITASGLDKGCLTPADFIWATCDATPCLVAETRTPSAECLLHEAIYQYNPTANAIYHIHSPYWTLLSTTLGQLTHPTVFPLPALEMLKGLGAKSHMEQHGLLTLPNSQYMPELVALLAPCWQQLTVPGFVLQGHGLYTWGSTVFEAKRHVEIFEFLAQQCYLQATIK
jgi:methylthioribulose-1-phosphate dehydratase